MILLFCLVATGCTPGHISITAIFLGDGHPMAVFHPCHGSRVYGVSVVESMTASGSGTSPSFGNVWDVADTDTRGDHPITEVRLLETPPGWILQTNPDSLLTAFAVDRTYRARADTTSPPAANDASVEFTLGDLRSLSDGEVWAVPKPFAQPQAMTREEFRRHAAASC
ncbi:hypothetical protein Q2K19_18995 [Micromonospora soli]|uniref:hypothetical protein n=1 Tax=Micromonospora sp. NBRC 110009 TaxID=3061627 RepID=UPI0026722066|nr:hypothetical protein [Micromonospora sp. NBRC 110009]WKT96310.1 hypothetical protein Q2K19_18995 [Micromonospora sp. NBRC 110009]